MAAVTVNAQARRSTSIASPKSGALLRSTSSLGHGGTLSSRHCIHARHGVKAKELTIKGALMARSTLQAACRAAGDRRIAGWSTKQQASPTPKRRGDMPGTRLDVFIKRKRSQWKVQLLRWTVAIARHGSSCHQHYTDTAAYKRTKSRSRRER